MTACRQAFAGFMLAAVMLAGGVLTGHAVNNAVLEVGSVAGEGWSAQGVAIRLAWLDESRVHLQLHARSARLPNPIGELFGLQLECPRASLAAETISCSNGRLQLASGGLGAQRAGTQFEYRFADGRLKLHLTDIRLYDGRVSVQGHYDKSGWQLNVTGDDLDMGSVAAQIATADGGAVKITGSGKIALQARFEGKGDRLGGARLSARLQASEFSDETGNLAGEDLQLELEANVAPMAGGWQMQAELTGRQGQLYIDPVFVEIPSRPISARARLEWRPQANRFLVHSFEYHHPGTVQVHANDAAFSGGTIDSMAVEVSNAAFPSLYETYLQPWLTETMLADLETAGHISGQLHWRDGGLERLRLDLSDVSLDDRKQRFGLAQVQGQIDWGRDDVQKHSELQWNSGHIYRVGLGPARFAAMSTGTRVHLPESVSIPVLDGMLQLDEFMLDYDSGEQLRWHVDGFLTPVSMKLLTQALGWPEFSGKLSGVIPDVRYDAGDLEVGGMLLVRVFDGAITLRNLRLEKPFGLIPRLWVDARADNIDLKTLTRTFSFGRIEGRLDGRIDGLYMESWLPVAFDASFATPDGDRSRHRISQKAVENISEIGGGGVGDALSRGLLGFFEDFPYDRLGISCRLENGVCDMDGVAPAPNGYYIVKGRLLPPRLNVIGYANRVDWNTLVSQIVAVTKHQGAVVQ